MARLLAIPSYLTIFDFGLTLSGAREITMRISDNKQEEAHSIYQSTTIAALTFMLTAIILAISAMHMFPISSLINVQQLDKNSLFIVLIILSFRVFLNVLITLYGLRLYCVGMYGINTAIHAGIRLLGFSLLILVAMLGGGIFEASEAMLLEGLTGLCL